jgi:hypothetical protein
MTDSGVVPINHARDREAAFADLVARELPAAYRTAAVILGDHELCQPRLQLGLDRASGKSGQANLGPLRFGQAREVFGAADNGPDERLPFVGRVLEHGQAVIVPGDGHQDLRARGLSILGIAPLCLGECAPSLGAGLHPIANA